MGLLAEEAVGLICPVVDKYFLTEGRVYAGAAVYKGYVAIVHRPIKILDEVAHTVGSYFAIEERSDEVISHVFAWLEEAAGGREKDKEPKEDCRDLVHSAKLRKNACLILIPPIPHKVSLPHLIVARWGRLAD